MAQASPSHFSSFLLILLIFALSLGQQTTAGHGLSIKEATIDDLQLAFKHNKLTSRQLVQFYLGEISKLNPFLKGVIEVNPDALYLADKADYERKTKAPSVSLSKLHGIPILVKDNIATKDKLNTTAGSYALLGSVVPRDAGVVTKLRKAGAIILGKASLSEWVYGRSNETPPGWSGRGGQGVNPYNFNATPSGSSSGSAISAAANLAAVTLGTETDGSILSPSSWNSVVGIKPTIGLTSRAGVGPVSPRQDTVGPIARTVSDAAYVLDVIAGIDSSDLATIEASRYIPKGGYAQFLRPDGLRGKRIGIVRALFNFGGDASLARTFEQHFNTLRKRGAVLVDNLEIAHFDEIYYNSSSESIALAAEFKIYLNTYLKNLVASPVRSLADVIAFNNKNSKLEKVKEYGQGRLLEAEATNGIGNAEKAALVNLAKLSKNGFEKLVTKKRLDAVVAPSAAVSTLLAIAGSPGVVVPAGYTKDGVPFGISFGGLRGSEPKLIEIAYGFEQATKIRKPPSLKKLQDLEPHFIGVLKQMGVLL
ncbi:PREDICTED: putative amidase [Prunus dulcis]|uniref:PREDICTED: putative amidase n=1 Tax=Prunus dulcis TaxID=3755 RepID=A0A5E4EP45_PRUDU|nr:probable amidase At4g34880 [Prunus dulcis]VVA15638.1 PREDICTED: putative amidase [Prunus dulcis]